MVGDFHAVYSGTMLVLCLSAPVVFITGIVIQRQHLMPYDYYCASRYITRLDQSTSL